MIQILAFLGIIQIILFFGHWFVYKTSVEFLQIRNPSGIAALKISFLILSVSFFISALAGNYFSGKISKTIYVISAIWLGLLLYLFLSSVLLQIANWFLSPELLGITAIILFGLSAIMTGYGIFNAQNVQIVRINISLPNLPEIWRGKKAAWISDIHLGPARGYEFSEMLAQMIKKENPDIIFYGGDFFDGGARNLDDFTKPFSQLNPQFGSYFITGNHEEFTDKTIYVNSIKSAGIRVLNNEMIDINGLQIIGVDYKDSEQKDGLKNILTGLNPDKNKPAILLKHAPTKLSIANDFGINFQISGHTHKGQIFPINFITKAVYRGYDYGLKSFGKMIVYTSSGAGTWGPPSRIGNHPEIAVIQLE